MPIYGNNFYPATYQSPVMQNPVQYQQYSQQSAPQMQYSQAPMMTQHPNTSGIIWVQGEVGAKAYPVSPGSSAILMDSEDERFYIKSTDASGMPLPLRVFSYSEEVSVQQSHDNAHVDTSQFVTRQELEEMLNDRMTTSQKKGKTNAESTV